MTDFDKMKSTFDDLKVEYKIETALERHGKDTYIVGRHSSIGKNQWDTCILLNEGVGYWGFEAEFYFLNGKYQGHGCWE